MTVKVGFDPVGGYRVNTKYIPYELFQDFKEFYNAEQFLKNRVSFFMPHTGLSMNPYSEVESIIADRFVSKCGTLSGRWTMLIMNKGDSHRVELMMEDDKDFAKLTSEVLLMDKLSRE